MPPKKAEAPVEPPPPSPFGVFVNAEVASATLVLVGPWGSVGLSGTTAHITRALQQGGGVVGRPGH
jgi:hypothetical protein